MCDFFSLVSNGRGKYFYSDWKTREAMKGSSFNPDSHSSIVNWFQDKGEIAKRKDEEAHWNKYEFNPLTKEFTIDQLNTRDDSEEAELFCNKLDFKKIIPRLIIKPIFNPCYVDNPIIGEYEISLLKEWIKVHEWVMDSVGASVGTSVWDSVRDSVGDSVGTSVRNSVWDSVWDSVRDSVGDSVGTSVRDSVWGSVRESVRASVRAYTSSFFHLDEWKYVKHEDGINPFQSCIDLWERGIVPSFDGKVWRLHGGSDMKVLKKFTVSELV